MTILLLVAFVVLVVFIVKKRQYEKTDYYHQTQNSFLSLGFDKGLLGEYYTYKYLRRLKGYKRYLFNLYLPKDNGETTELDVILLHESGIYVLESKNYSGWIFGTETQQYWTQTLPSGEGKKVQKNQFFNPILQNKGHLKWLQIFLSDQTLPFYSYIVFSDRCTLKKITLTSGEHVVVNRYNLLASIQQNFIMTGARLTPDKIDALFEKLYPLTQVDEVGKIRHVQNIQEKKQQNVKKAK